MRRYAPFLPGPGFSIHICHIGGCLGLSVVANGGVRSRNHSPVVLAALVKKTPGRLGCGGEDREQSERAHQWCLFERKRHVNCVLFGLLYTAFTGSPKPKDRWGC